MFVCHIFSADDFSRKDTCYKVQPPILQIGAIKHNTFDWKRVKLKDWSQKALMSFNNIFEA